LRAAATGSLPILYQWRFNKSDLPGAVGSTLTLPNVHASDEGAYTVRTIAGGYTNVSAPAIVMLDAPFRLFHPPGVACGQRWQIAGPAGRSFSIEFSTNFGTWLPILTNVQATGIADLNTSNSVTGRGFYRAKLLP
jgi:hypothetical protein